MRKLILIAIAAASYYIAGMYRQMPLMILAVMEWLLLVFLIFFPRCLRRNTILSFPMQNSEAEKGSEKNCMVRIDKVLLYDYLSAFSAAKTIHAQMKVVVLLKARELPIQSYLVKSAVDRQKEF